MFLGHAINCAFCGCPLYSYEENGRKGKKIKKNIFKNSNPNEKKLIKYKRHKQRQNPQKCKTNLTQIIKENNHKE